jgi:hypothetical protein
MSDWTDQGVEDSVRGAEEFYAERDAEAAQAPASAVEEIDVIDNVTIEVRGPDGKLKQREVCHNLVVTVGKNGIADQLLASPTISKPSHMAIGTGSTAAAAGDTTLQTELDRNALTSKTRSANVVTMVGDWAAGDGTGAITEAGIFDASSAGNMYVRAVFSVVNKGASDTLSLSWALTIG